MSFSSGKSNLTQRDFFFFRFRKERVKRWLWLFLLIHTHLACMAKGVFHVTVPAPAKVSIFKNSIDTLPTVILQEDSNERQNFIVSLPQTVFEETTPQGIINKSCDDIFYVLSSDESLINSSSITMIKVDGGCQISFNANPNTSGEVVLTGVSKLNPLDTIAIPVSITPLNDPPYVPDLAPSISSEDVTTVVTIPLLDDTQGLTCEKAITATSSNEALLPNSRISLAGLPPNCVLTFTPLAEQSGNSEITLSISDGEFFVTKTLAVSVAAVNDPPVVFDVIDKTTIEDIPLNGIGVNLYDVDSAIDCSFLSIASSNTSLVPQTGMSVTGVSTNCSVNLTPASNQAGLSTITLTVSDGSLTGTDSFVLTVNPINDAPTVLNVTDQTTLEDTPILGITIVINDIDTVLSCSALTAESTNTQLISQSKISFAGNGSSCNLNLSTELNQHGSSTITIKVSDGSFLATDQFLLTVSPVNDFPIISDVTNQITSDGVAITGVPVIITDIDSGLTCSSISVTSSNSALIPSSGVTFSGIAPNCSMNVTPLQNNTGSSTITLTVSDGLLEARDEFTVTVNQVNLAPTDLALSSQSLPENSAANTLVATLSATDPNPGDTFSFSLVAGLGDADNTAFTVQGNQLNMVDAANFEAKSSYAIRLRVVDQGGLYFDKEITILITNVNEAPNLSSIADQITIQNKSTSPIAFTVTDPDGPSAACDSNFLSYTSQNTSVVPTTGAVSWSGTWPNCMAVISPKLGATGIAVVSIQVSDGSVNSLPQSFNLTVESLPLGWYQEAYIKASNANASDYFGTGLGISADTAIVGSPGESSNQTTITNGTLSSTVNSAALAGAGYIYKRVGSTWAQEAYIKASNADGNSMFGDEFGWAVAISRDTAIVGASGEASNQTTVTNGTFSSTDNSIASAGACYVYRRSGSTWYQEAYIKPSTPHYAQIFGSSVAISGDIAVIGAKNDSSSQTTVTNGPNSSLGDASMQYGASFIYKRNGSQWAQEAYLKSANINFSDNFGNAIAISGETVIVGALYEDSNQTTITNGATASSDNSAGDSGAVYIFRSTGTIWAQEAYLKASNANSYDSFGNSVSLSGNTAVVGAPYESSNQIVITNGSTSSTDNSRAGSGAAYIYQRSENLWSQSAYIKASNANSSDSFGQSVAISGSTVIVGASNEDSNQTTITNGTTSSTLRSAVSSGASYIYQRTASIWSQEAYIKASNADQGDYFGDETFIAGDTAIVGATHESSSQSTITNGTGSSLDKTAMNAGAVYVYRNLGRMFEVYEVASITSSTSISVSWVGTNLGSAIGQFKVVYSTTIPSTQCSSGTTAYTGTASSTTISSGLTPGQKYILRICTFDGVNYSEGVTTEVTVKGDDLGPVILSINRGSTPNPVAFGTPLIDYIVTFDEPIIGLSVNNFSLSEVGTTGGASGRITGVSCNASLCTVLVAPSSTGQLRLDLSNTYGVADIWGNSLSLARTGDQTYFLATVTGWYQEAYIKASNAASGHVFGKASISGDTVIVGAIGESSSQNFITNGSTSTRDNIAPNAGASYIFKRSGATWTQEAYLKASNAEAFDLFGEQVSISGDTAIVSAIHECSAQTTITNGQTSSFDNTLSLSGASYIYKRAGFQWSQEAYIKASNADADDRFGSSVSIQGDVAIVGASQEDSNQIVITNGTTSSLDDSLSGAGSAYLYRRLGNIWAQEAFLKAANANIADSFGFSASTSGDTAIIGAIAEASRQTIITNGSTASNNNSFSGAGAGYIYRRTGGIWNQESYLKASNTSANLSYYSWSVSLSGDSAIVGAIFESSNQTTITNGTTSSLVTGSGNAGASFIYRRTGTSWAQEAYLKASNAESSDYYGDSVAISGNTAIVGAYGESSGQTTISNSTLSSADNNAIGAGAAYIYRLTGGLWTQEAYLKAPNAEFNDGLGNSVGLSGDTVIVDASQEDSSQTSITNGQTASADNSAINSGSVYIYRNLSRIFDPDLRISGKTTTSITLSWGKNLGSTIRVKIAPAVTGNNNPLACTDASAVTLGSGVNTYTYTGLTPSTRYGFRLCGFDGTNVSQGAIIRDSTN